MSRLLAATRYALTLPSPPRARGQEFGAQIGCGAYGKVFIARRLADGAVVVVKEVGRPFRPPPPPGSSRVLPVAPVC